MGLSGPPASQLLATFHRTFENAFEKLEGYTEHNAQLRGVSAQLQLNSCCIFNLFIAHCTVYLC